MRPIPLKIRKLLAEEPRMKSCIYASTSRACECDGRIEWEHALTYAGKQINEPTAIIGVCVYHHRGEGLNKDYNRYRALLLADLDYYHIKYPRVNWKQIFTWLHRIYKDY